MNYTVDPRNRLADIAWQRLCFRPNETAQYFRTLQY